MRLLWIKIEIKIIYYTYSYNQASPGRSMTIDAAIMLPLYAFLRTFCTLLVINYVRMNLQSMFNTSMVTRLRSFKLVRSLGSLGFILYTLLQRRYVRQNHVLLFITSVLVLFQTVAVRRSANT